MTNEYKHVRLTERELTKTQSEFLAFCEDFGWGKLEVSIKNGEPVMAAPVVKEGVVQHYRKFD